MPDQPTVIDEYLAGVPEAQRAALEHVRAVIRSAAPEAEETIGYSVPAFRFEERWVGGFSASKAHLSYFPFSGSTAGQFAEELEGFETTKGSIHFQPDHPLPDDLIRRMVESRVAANRKK
jgi:uncharacterized protein YdhG (YjbR/CyaY superfamily)